MGVRCDLQSLVARSLRSVGRNHHGEQGLSPAATVTPMIVAAVTAHLPPTFSRRKAIATARRWDHAIAVAGEFTGPVPAVWRGINVATFKSSH